MTYLQAIIPLIEGAYDGLWTNAQALGDKLDYKPSEATRTPLEMLKECAQVPETLATVIRNRKMPEDMDAEYAEAMKVGETLTTIEACREHFGRTKGALYNAIDGFPDDKLEEEIATPWGTFSWRDFIAYAYWNPMYHTGQLAYIQMIHGDAEMH